MTTYYRLILHKNNSERVTIMPNIDGANNDGVTLTGISFRKKIFSHCEIEVSLKSFKPNDYESIIATYSSYERADMEFVTGEKCFKIAENYIIREIKPRFSSTNSQTSVDLFLKICSPDIRLSDRKYCRTYVRSKLSDILKNAIVEFLPAPKSPDTTKQEFENFETHSHFYHSYDGTNLQFLKYTNTSNGDDELRHPYLVQYNESVYDLIARTANRCGEFLYYENGEMHLGLPYSMEQDKKTIKATKIEKYDSLTINEDVMGTTDDTTKRHVFDNKFVVSGENSSALMNDIPVYPVNNEIAYDDYLGSIKKDGYDTADGEDSVNSHIVASIFSLVLQCKVLYETLVDIGVMVGMRAAANKRLSDSANEDFNKKYFPKDAADSDYGKDQYNSKGDVLSQFKTNPQFISETRKELPNKEIDNAFYDFIFSVESAVASNNIEIKFEAGFIQDIKLGDIISVPSATKSIYVVTEVCGSEKNISKTSDNPSDILFNWKEEMTIKAVKIFNNTPVPPPCVSDFIRRGGGQTAYVKDVNDPYRAGRVRLQFPWDPLKEMSPWARVAMPKANHTGGGEAYFKPSIDDEVLVEYIGGNMERPYVSGFLHGMAGLEYGGRFFNNVISTPGGQTIRQKDTASTSALGAISPLYSTLQKLTPKVDTDVGKWSEQFLGFTEITDTYGIYDITLSSEKRKISIESPFGKVEINAFTGISIDAPNGDISISGKNVSIEAGNNLSIVSGTNLKTDTIANAGNFSSIGTVIANVLVKKLLVEQILAKIIDLTLIRTLVETIIKPVEGTLEIKSNRYLLIEAGDGEAQIPKSAYIAKKVADRYPTDTNFIALISAVNSARRWAESIVNDYTRRYTSLINAKNEYVNVLGEKANLVPNHYKFENIYQTLFILPSTARFTDETRFSADQVNAGRSLRDAAQRLKVASFDTSKDFINDILYSKKVKKAFEDAVKEVAADNEHLPFVNSEAFDISQPENTAIGKGTTAFRLVVTKMLGKVADDCGLALPANFSTNDWTTDANWTNLLDADTGVKLKEPANLTGLDKFANDFTDAAAASLKTLNPFKRLSDIGVWDEDHSKGEMLFSDSKEKTARFSNEGTFKTFLNVGNLEDKQDDTAADFSDSMHAKLNVLRNVMIHPAQEENIVPQEILDQWQVVEGNNQGGDNVEQVIENVNQLIGGVVENNGAN